MSGEESRSVDPGQIRSVAEDSLPTVADHLTLAEEGLRNTRALWELPFAGSDLYQSAGDGWAELCVTFGKVLLESADRLEDTCGHLLWAADRYAQAEASGTQIVEDVFEVVEVVPA